MLSGGGPAVFKLMGALLVLGGGVLAAVKQRLLQRKGRELLCDLMAALREMAQEIRMTRKPLPEILGELEHTYDGDAAAFFACAVRCMGQGMPLVSSWQTAASALPLSREIKRVIAGLGDHLHYDEESVCEAVSLALYELAKYAEEWDRQHTEADRRSTALWMSAAALLVILLI